MRLRRPIGASFSCSFSGRCVMADIFVLGAGMVGISTALALQARGHAVSVIDRGQPGRETSFGNAGIIQAEAAEPYALPRDLLTLLSFAVGRSNDVTWSLRGLFEMTPALLSYFRHSAPRRHAAISASYARLTARATDDHAPLITASGAQNLISKDGLSLLYRDPQAFEKAAQEAERVARKYGLDHRAVDGADYRADDPALLKAPAGAIHWTDSWSCASPGDLVAAYAALFCRQGGRILTGDAASLHQTGTGWRVTTTEGDVTGSDAVIALGPWSPRLLRAFGYRIPMIYKRGYHAHFRTARAPKRPFLDVANGVVAAGMLGGLRVATGAALVARHSPSNTSQLTRGVKGLGDLLDIGAPIDDQPWSGTRPCLPDMLPLVGAAPRHKGLWFNFGHGHQGFTLGPTTGAILAAALAREPDDIARALSPQTRLA